MTEPTKGAQEHPDSPEDLSAEQGDRTEGSGPTIRDRRRIDPQTGQPRHPEGVKPDPSSVIPDPSSVAPGSSSVIPDPSSVIPGEDPGAQDPIAHAKFAELEELVAERTADLQRLQAEYANYKKRVDRDRGLARTTGIEAVVTDLLPVLDSIEAAREHDELVGGFKLVADELEKLATKYGLEVYGEVGEVFDPQVHEALMHMPYPGEEEITETVVSAVMQKGVKLNDRVLRPARVGVADPD